MCRIFSMFREADQEEKERYKGKAGIESMAGRQQDR